MTIIDSRRPASHSAQQDAAGSAAVALATAWAASTLPAGSVLIADQPLRDALLGQGLPAGSLLDPANAGGSLPARPAGFVFATESLRLAAQAGNPPAATLLARSQPVAVFGTGAGQIQVRQLLPAGTATADRATRTMAGRSLLSNPAIGVDPSLTQQLAAGQLDLRAASLLAVLAARGPIRLNSLPQDASEAAAGAPIRVVWLAIDSTTNPRLAQLIDSLPAAYQPVRSTRLPDGRYALEWAPDLDIPAPVS